jgi:hypothetical protein
VNITGAGVTVTNVVVGSARFDSQLVILRLPPSAPGTSL